MSSTTKCKLYDAKISSDFFTPELLDLVSHDYEVKGSKRLRSSKAYPDNDWVMVKIGTGWSLIFSS